MIILKEYIYFIVIDFKEMQMYILFEIKFKIINLRKFSEI